MREELIVSGRMNQGIDPVLHIWGWEIALYLFFGGLAAGILIYTGLYGVKKRQHLYSTALNLAPLFVPVFLIVGLITLFIDLHHKLYFWQLYTNINFQSPMSWGAWTLMLITPLSIVYALLQLKKIIPHITITCKTKRCISAIIEADITTNANVNWNWKMKWMRDVEDFCNDNIQIFYWAMMILGIILGIYTGILLSAFNARPLWNTSIMGPLFLVSGLSTAAAFIMLLSKDENEIHFFAQVDLVMVALELFLITHMFMGFNASTQVQIDAAALFLGGSYTVVFWVFVVFLGLLMPAALEIMEMRGYKLPTKLAPILILLGGLLLRFVIVYAGQASRYLY